jgi:replication initiation and membrane attachment protein DnaB
MTEKQVRGYIKYTLQKTPRHDCKALASAVNDVSEELDHDESELLYLLLENRPIDAIHTHSYGFHTANGREIINRLKEKYYEYESAS